MLDTACMPLFQIVDSDIYIVKYFLYEILESHKYN